MTSPADKRDPSRGWRWVEGVIDEEADRLATASDAQAERELARLPPPPRVPSVNELLGRARERAGTAQWNPPSRGGTASPRPAPRQAPGAEQSAAEGARRRWRAVRWAPWLVAAVIGFLVVLVVRRHDESGESQPRRPTADELRSLALHDCDRGAWKACLQGLDAARAQDPAGDETPEVRSARAKAEQALRAPGERAP